MMSVTRDIKSKIVYRSLLQEHATAETITRVISTRDEVEFNIANSISVTMKRSDLILALGVTKEDLEELRGKRREGKDRKEQNRS